ncbi:MAG: hypothetical protein GF315_02955, partial [candidate division Zixibacteria bacterium]|nr:hypothetical protein [candidate division Zixibacteria bacterium]
MKHLLTVLVVILSLTTMAAAEQVQVQPLAEDVMVTVEESNPSRIVVRFDIGAFDKRAVDINGDTYYRIKCAREGVMSNKGEPALPHINRSVIIPDNAKMAVKVLSSEYKDYPSTPIAPSKGNLKRNVNPEDIPYEFGDVYGSGSWYTNELVSLRDPHILRDLRGVVIELYAFRYHTGDQTLRVYSSVTVELSSIGAGEINVLNRTKPLSSVVPEFDNLYKQRFLNYDSGVIRYNPVPEGGSMLIITYDDFYDSMMPLVQWKLQKGIPTTMVRVSEIGNNPTSIGNYIQAFYDTTDLCWVLLVGDINQIASPTAWWGAADPTYVKLAGNDDYPDAFIGRFSAENNNHVLTQVQRTLEYEMESMSGDWFHKGMGVASNQGPGHYDEYDDEHMDYIRDDLLAYTYTEVDQIYDPYATSAMVTNGLHDGRSIVNYCGHGSMISWGTTGFSNSNVNALQNVGMLPFMISVACNNGEFDSGTCFGEAWLRATYNGAPTGALAVYMSSISQSWDPPMYGQDEAVDLLVADAMNTFGGYCFNGSCLMIEIEGMDGVEMYDTWHIFGDPSVQLRTDTPQPVTVNHQGVIPFGQNYYNVEVPGVSRALCALYYEGTLFGSAHTDGNGNATITLDGGTLPIGAEVLLTVTAYNKQTHTENVPVITEGWGAIGGRVTDEVTGDGLAGMITVTNRDPQIVGNCNDQGYYLIYVPADSIWDLRAEHTNEYLPSFAQVMTTEDDTVMQDFQLEPKVEVILRASFGNPEDIAYRTFYFRGSWNDDGFY